jgi:predicted Zn-dependent protease
LSYAAAAATLSASLSGIADRDRPFLTTLSDLWAHSGDSKAAGAPLQRGVDAWPHDPTFFLSMARLLNDQGEWEAALPYAVAGMSLAWGDNHLRTVAQAARALHGIGRKDEALALIDQTLGAVERPQDGIEVRTPRYITALETLRAEIAG